MNINNKLLCAFIRINLVLQIFLISGCANLSSVRDFSKQSANLTAGTEAVDYWAGWEKRSKRFDLVIAKLPVVEGQKKLIPTGPISSPPEEQIKSIKGLQGVLTAYLIKLGALADDDLVDVSDQVKDLVESLNDLPTTENRTAEEASKINDAYGSILKLVKLPLDAYRHRKVKQLISENNDHIKKLTEGLSNAMGSVSLFVSAEKANVISWYDVITDRYPSKNFSEAMQWEKDRNSIVADYDAKTNAIKTYKSSLDTIGTMHNEMSTKISTFDSDSFKSLVAALNEAKEEIKIARDKYEKAFPELKDK